MELKNLPAYVDASKNLRNAHIINKSHIVNRTSYMANAFLMRLPRAFADWTCHFGEEC